MKANLANPEAETQRPEGVPPAHTTSAEEIDLPLLEESLSKTVWERMLANDDALRLADTLQEAMLKRRAKS